MTEEQAYRIREWLDGAEHGAQSAEHFERGVALLGEVMTNLFYLGNIRRKGPAGGMATLKYELGKRVNSSECLKFGVPKVEKSKEHGAWSMEQRAGSKEQGESPTQPPQAGRSVGDTRSDSDEKKRFVLREEFPFLVKDDCPEEFKVLVADMITAHDRYMKAHNELYAVANKDNEACFAVARVLVENYLNNRRCWNELEHYKKTGQILGEHELFAKRNREKELKEMPVTELMALYRNLPRNIRYYGKLVEDDPDNELTAERLKKKEWFEWELKNVKRLMDVRERKAKSKEQRAKSKGRRAKSKGQREKVRR